MSSSDMVPPRGILTVNLAPADVSKHGTLFDLPIALGLILAGSAPEGVGWPADHACAGELSLDGRIQPVKGILPFVLAARRSGKKRVIVPAENALEASHVPGVTVYPVGTLTDAVAHAVGTARIKPFVLPQKPRCAAGRREKDLSDVVGQSHAVDALEVAAAGGHNLLMTGPPGCGKTMLAERFTGILPEWSQNLALQSNCIHSLKGLLTEKGWKPYRPFRAPHHTISRAGMLGGGRPIGPGEVSLAHGGVLFLDEFTRFSRSVIEGLREPLQSGKIGISRLRETVTFPAGFQLIAAMNPCPCGWKNTKKRKCTCSDMQKLHYAARLSGPILDRIDMHIELQAVNPASFREGGTRTTRQARQNVLRAIRFRARRNQSVPNAQLTGVELEALASEGALDHVEIIMGSLGLSARSRVRILRVARTCADLEGHRLIQAIDVRKACNNRRLDGLEEKEQDKQKDREEASIDPDSTEPGPLPSESED